MKTYTTYANLPAEARGAFIAIGNFDGVHKGHQTLLRQAREQANAHGKKLGVLTFEPHPRRLFRPDDPPFRLTPEPLKRERLQACGVDLLFCLNFDWNFASQSAETFIDDILRSGLQPSHVVVGQGFRFGQLRKGTADTLKDSGIPVSVPGRLLADGSGQTISSSRIRQYLSQGDIAEANDLLGWPWEIEGIVVKGDQRGRTLGFPTANLALGETLHPAYGIYAAQVRIVEDGPGAPWHLSATNIGIRPMFEVPVGLVEAHILNFSREIYGKTLRVRPVTRLRGEARFETLDALVKQMAQDCRQAEDLLKKQISS